MSCREFRVFFIAWVLSLYFQEKSIAVKILNSGLQRKICKSLDPTDKRIYKFSGHKLILVGRKNSTRHICTIGYKKMKKYIEKINKLEIEKKILSRVLSFWQDTKRADPHLYHKTQNQLKIDLSKDFLTCPGTVDQKKPLQSGSSNM